MQIIINIFLFCAKISEKAIYFRPFWNSLLPYKIYVFFTSKSLRMTMIQDYVWDVIINGVHFWGMLHRSYTLGCKQDNTFRSNIMKIADLLPADVKKDFLKDMI